MKSPTTTCTIVTDYSVSIYIYVQHGLTTKKRYSQWFPWIIKKVLLQDSSSIKCMLCFPIFPPKIIKFLPEFQLSQCIYNYNKFPKIKNSWLVLKIDYNRWVSQIGSWVVPYLYWVILVHGLVKDLTVRLVLYHVGHRLIEPEKQSCYKINEGHRSLPYKVSLYKWRPCQTYRTSHFHN